MSDQNEPSTLRDRRTGLIQPHGVLLVASEDSWQITHASANVEGMIGWPLEDVLAKPLRSLLTTRQLDMPARPWP